MDDFLRKTPTDGFIHISSKKNIITKVKPPDQMTVDLIYSAKDNVFLDADGLVYLKNEEPDSTRPRKQRKTI